MRYSELKELFNQQGTWSWRTTVSEQIATSMINGKKLEVAFNQKSPPSTYSLAFSVDGSFRITSTGDQFQILATVIAIIKEFTKSHNVDELYFDATLDEPSRVRLYTTLANKLSSAIGFQVQEKERGIYKIFTLTKVMDESLMELFDTTASWSWSRRTDNIWEGSFTIDETTYTMVMYGHEDEWEITFNVGGTHVITGGGNALKVFSTIGKMLMEFINTKDPLAFEFSAKNKEPSRVSLYKKMAGMIANQIPYSMEEMDDSVEVYFKFKRKE